MSDDQAARQVDTARSASLLAARYERDISKSGERTRLACWFWRPAKTIFSLAFAPMEEE
jgi:hypothetical protein